MLRLYWYLSSMAMNETHLHPLSFQACGMNETHLHPLPPSPVGNKTLREPLAHARKPRDVDDHHGRVQLVRLWCVFFYDMMCLFVCLHPSIVVSPRNKCKIVNPHMAEDHGRCRTASWCLSGSSLRRLEKKKKGTPSFYPVLSGGRSISRSSRTYCCSFRY